MIQPLVDFNYWANRRLLDAVEKLPADLFTREIDREFSFPTLEGTLVHIMGGELVWLARWRGLSTTELKSPERHPTASALRTHWETAEQELRRFVTETDPERIIGYRTTEGQPFRAPLWQMVQHVVNHGTHHRSEVATMLTRLGHQPPALDLMVYYMTAAGS